MESRLNPRLVGLFVIGSVTLVIVVFVVFGTGTFFKGKSYFSSYFATDVSGLEVGAPVKFRGVQIGSVKKITPMFTEKGDYWVEVDMETIHGIIEIEGDFLEGYDDLQTRDELVKLGLRAQLNSLSMLTGQLYVKLDYWPDTEVMYVSNDPGKVEIPSIKAPLETIGQDLNDIIDAVKALEIDEMIATLTTMLKTIDDKVASINLDPTLDEMNNTLKTTSEMLISIDSNLDTTFAEFRIAARSATASLNRAEELLENFDNMASENRYELREALREMTYAAKNIQSLTEYLERDPNSILFGK